MSPREHPDEDMLLACAMGAAPPGASLVIQAHLTFCAHCRTTMRLLDQLGGALLEDTAPEPVAAGMLGRVLTGLDAHPPEAAAPTRLSSPQTVVASLSHGPWKSFGPGLQLADVEGPFEANETVCLLKGEAGALVPRHGHEDTERFIVLEGAFGLDARVYWPGDYIEANHDVTHTPFVPKEQGCLCLFALEGGLVFKGEGGRPRPDAGKISTRV